MLVETRLERLAVGGTVRVENAVNFGSKIGEHIVRWLDLFRPEIGNRFDDFGATGRDLRIWGAREAVKQGELALSASASSIESLSRTATSLLGYSITLSTALLAVGATYATRVDGVAAAVAACFSLTSGILFASVIRPKRWKQPGQDPRWILEGTFDGDGDYSSELDILEAIASGYSEALQENQTAIRSAASRLAFGWWAFLGIPVSAALTEIISHPSWVQHPSW